jgi:hypothetical protein
VPCNIIKNLSKLLQYFLSNININKKVSICFTGFELETLCTESLITALAYCLFIRLVMNKGFSYGKQEVRHHWRFAGRSFSDPHFGLLHRIWVGEQDLLQDL